LLKIPFPWRNFDISTAISLSFWYKIEQPKKLNVFICSIMLLSVTILLLVGSLSLKVVVFVLLFGIYGASSKSATITEGKI
jgi:hypothetical protein